jgi:hypothetical protein
VYADGSPARALPVWFWRADDRPRWTRRVDDAVEATVCRGVAEANREPAPPPPTFATGAGGLVALPVDAERIEAITVEIAERQWFSAALPEKALPLVLPALAEVEIAVTGAPADARWLMVVIPAFTDGNGKGQTTGAQRENVATASGDGVVRLGSAEYRRVGAERVRAPMLLGHLAMVSGGGLGCRIEGVHHVNYGCVTAPALVEYRYLRPFPVLEVRVVDAATGAAAGSGTVRLVNAPSSELCHELTDGVARFDTNELERRVYPLRVLMADGESFARECPFAPENGVCTVTFRRGEGVAPWTVRLPALDRVVTVFLELAGGGLARAAPFADFVSRDRGGAFAVAQGQLLLAAAPESVCRLWIVAGDGRVATVAVAASQRSVDATWLDGAPLDPIDVGGLLRARGDPAQAQVDVELRIEFGNGIGKWVRIADYQRQPKAADPGPPPVWRGLSVPKALRGRLEVRGGNLPSQSCELPRR